MTLKFAKHNDADCNNKECWHVFNAAAINPTSQEGVVEVDGEMRDMNDEDCLDGSLGFIKVINGVPVWNSNVVGNSWSGVTDDVTATQLREIAEFMETFSVADVELAKLGL